MAIDQDIVNGAQIVGYVIGAAALALFGRSKLMKSASSDRLAMSRDHAGINSIELLIERNRLLEEENKLLRAENQKLGSLQSALEWQSKTIARLEGEVAELRAIVRMREHPRPPT